MCLQKITSKKKKKNHKRKQKKKDNMSTRVGSLLSK